MDAEKHKRLKMLLDRADEHMVEMKEMVHAHQQAQRRLSSSEAAGVPTGGDTAGGVAAAAFATEPSSSAPVDGAEVRCIFFCCHTSRILSASFNNFSTAIRRRERHSDTELGLWRRPHPQREGR